MASSAERMRRLRAKKAEEGQRAITVMLSPVTHDQLAYLQKYGESLSVLFARLIDEAYRARKLVTSDTEILGSLPAASVTSDNIIHVTGDEGAPGSVPAPNVTGDERARARILELHAGGLSLQGIADQLEREGIKTARGLSKWSKGTVGNIIARARQRAGPA